MFAFLLAMLLALATPSPPPMTPSSPPPTSCWQAIPPRADCDPVETTPTTTIVIRYTPPPVITPNAPPPVEGQTAIRIVTADAPASRGH